MVNIKKTIVHLQLTVLISEYSFFFLINRKICDWLVQACHKFWKLMQGRLQRWLIKHSKGMDSPVQMLYNDLMPTFEITIWTLCS